MDCYRKEYKILSSDTDLHQRLRLSRLFTFLQEAAIAHTEQLGAGREKTLDRGLLWVVTLQHAKIARLPRYDEHILLESLPGEMMHTFFPRYYRITDAHGNELVNASALWMLMDCDTRTMVFPQQVGVTIDGETPPWQSFLPRTPKLPTAGETQAFTVPYSYVDLNGHMNNTRYFDLAEDLMPDTLRDASVQEILTEYTGEAKLGEEILLTRETQETAFLLAGTAQKRLFRIAIHYERGETDGL